MFGLACVLTALSCSAAASDAQGPAESERDRWIDTYGVASEDDALVIEARGVLRVLLRVQPPRPGLSIDLFVLRAHPEPQASAPDEHTIVVTRKLLEFCCPSGACDRDGRAALAFVLGHELAHIAAGDAWQPERDRCWQGLSAAARGEIRRRSGSSPGWGRELKADKEGFWALLLAGFKSDSFLNRNEFLSKWVRLRPSADGKPSASTLQNLLETEFKKASGAVEPLHFGVRLLQLGGRQSDAELLLTHAMQALPQAGRELYTNRGSARLERTLQALGACDPRLALRFKLPLMLDPHALVTRTYRGVGSACANTAQVKGPLDLAIADFDEALRQAPDYWPARTNRASALLLAAVLDATRAAEALGIDTPDFDAEVPPDEQLDPGIARLVQALTHQIAAVHAWPPPLARRVAWSWLTTWRNPVHQHLAALARALYFPRFAAAALSRGPLEELSTLLARHCTALVVGVTAPDAWQNCAAMRFNLARLQRERGEAESARASFEAFLELEPSGAFARAARRELGREDEDEASAGMLARPLEPRLPRAAAALAQRCEWQAFASASATSTLRFCVRDGLRALRVDKTVELYELDLGDEGPSLERVVRERGRPLTVHESPLGRWTYVYADSAYDFEANAQGDRQAVTEVLFTPPPTR